MKAWVLVLEIVGALLANILISYLIVPQFIQHKSKYYNLNDFYLAVYIGLIISACQLFIVFCGIWVFFDLVQERVQEHR